MVCFFADAAYFNIVGTPVNKGVGSIMVWTPTERLADEDSEFVCVFAIMMMSSPNRQLVDAYLAIAKEKFGYGAEQVLYNSSQALEFEVCLCLFRPWACCTGTAIALTRLWSTCQTSAR